MTPYGFYEFWFWLLIGLSTGLVAFCIWYFYRDHKRYWSDDSVE